MKRCRIGARWTCNGCYRIVKLVPGGEGGFNEMRRHHALVATAKHQAIGSGVMFGKAQIGAAHGEKTRLRRLLRRFVGGLGQRLDEFFKSARGDFAQQMAHGWEMVLGGGMGDAGTPGNLAERHLLHWHFGQSLFTCGEKLLVQVAMMIGFVIG